MSLKVAAFICGIFIFLVACVYSEDTWFISNLEDKCLLCICHSVTGCNRTVGCKDGYCGPFKISRLYWIDAGSPELPGSRQENQTDAYRECANDFECAKKTVIGYFKFLGSDCNGDSVTDCEDFLMMHVNGGWSCEQPLQDNEFNRVLLERYRSCQGKV